MAGMMAENSVELLVVLRVVLRVDWMDGRKVAEKVAE